VFVFSVSNTKYHIYCSGEEEVDYRGLKLEDVPMGLLNGCDMAYPGDIREELHKAIGEKGPHQYLKATYLEIREFYITIMHNLRKFPRTYVLAPIF